MIKKRHEMPVEPHDNWCNGRGHADAVSLMTSEESRGKFKLAYEVTLEKGGLIGDHPHTDDADLYLITQGTARVNDNGEYKIIGAGELIYTPEGEHHSIENIGGCDLKFFALVIR